MGSSGQLYSLSWAEFGNSLTSAVQLLRGHGDLVDVTLAAGGRSFPAHKIVLSAASPFLLDLLKSTPCQHPVVMLAGISSDDLESLLEFVYRGEVSVEPSQLPSLLQAAHCLSIHGLTPPTVLTENGEEVPASAIPENTEPVTREAMNSCIPNHRRKKRRKSSSSSGKWPRLDNATDSEERQDDDRTTDYEQKNDETNHGDDGTELENSHHHWPGSKSTASIKSENSQNDMQDSKKNLQKLLPALNQQYSPLHIPSFPGGLLPHGYLQASTSSTVPGGKAKGASDCPGQCGLCGAKLRQARNLRRHLLTSCKYRFNSATQHLQEPVVIDIKPDIDMSDQTVVEIKPDIDMSGYIGHNYMNDSGGSNSCEQILFRSSPIIGGGRESEVVNHQNGQSSTVAR